MNETADEPTSVATLTAEIVSRTCRTTRSLHRNSPGSFRLSPASCKVGAKPEAPVEEKPEPAVSVRGSIRPDHLVCLICGKKQKLLKRHLAVEHQFTPNQYRETFGLKPDYPMWRRATRSSGASLP